MMRLEVATLSVHTGKAAAVQFGFERHFRAGQGAGTLCASWTSESGGLNRVLVLRAFDDSGTMHAERERMLVSGDIFGVYEFRVYRIEPSKPPDRKSKDPRRSWIAPSGSPR
ncbi:MAG TPA: NIPSNAP family protein [Casimicrobiaceae bacterium]|nr:NIPSNAP family protein [Casimicrobiaceae bacterium]